MNRFLKNSKTIFIVAIITFCGFEACKKGNTMEDELIEEIIEEDLPIELRLKQNMIKVPSDYSGEQSAINMVLGK